jgi:hypothetical protein
MIRSYLPVDINSIGHGVSQPALNIVNRVKPIVQQCYSWVTIVSIGVDIFE